MKAKEVLSRQFLKVDVNDTVSKFIGLVKNNLDDDALVFDKKLYKGIVNKQWLWQSKTDMTKTKVKRFVSHVEKIGTEMDIKDVAKAMYVSDAKILPVFEKERVIGIVKAKDLLNQIKGKAKADDVGSKNITVMDENERYGTALHILKEKKLGRVPIVDKKGELIGIVTIKEWMKHYLIWPKKWDVGFKERPHTSGTKAFRGEKNNLLDLPIQDSMKAYNLITAAPNADISEIITLMIKENISSVILVKNKKPVGIVTIRDILRWFVTKA